MIARSEIDGAVYRLPWGGRSWVLDLERDTPGLTTLDGSIGPLRAIDGIAATGRSARGVFGRSCLVSHEVRADRVEVVYAPEGWNTLRVRASWWPRDPSTIDLEVQIQAFTVDELRAVEILVASEPGEGRGFAVADPSTALAEFDPDGSGMASYLQIGHPEDLARGVEAGGRCRLFGHDLEKGVVLRGRMRGVWMAGKPGIEELSRTVGNFLDQPLPLGT